VCRPGSSDADVFEEVFVDREYSALDAQPHVGFVLDCGANVGYSSAYFLTRFPGCRVLAVEPDPSNFALLQQNLAPYGERARALHAAVWSHETEMVLSGEVFGDGREWSRQVRERVAGERGSFRGVDVGTLLFESREERISILKMDVEGAEAVVFAGSVSSWIDRVDAIAIELHEGTVFGLATPLFVAACDGRFSFSRRAELTTCRRRPRSERPPLRPAIVRLHPDTTRAGAGFNVQPNGSSAMAVECSRVTSPAWIFFGDTPLPTSFGDGALLTAFVPAALYAEPGLKPVRVVDEAGFSNALDFRVTP